jgi:molybdenum cofactor guanylyltransferase
VYESIQPVVLVGGRSRRFGRDKLREPLDSAGSEWLVDRPIRALREVFGPRVALVGDCDGEVAARADLIIPDPYPGRGPAGGILAALEAVSGAGGDILVLPGDLPGITSRSIRRLIGEAASHPAAWTILAATSGPEPCIGIYRQAARQVLAQRVGAGEFRLHDLAPKDCRRFVPIDAAEATNLNTPEDLARRGGR